MSGNSQRMWNWFSEIFLGVDGVDHSIRLSSRRFWVKLSDSFGEGDRLKEKLQHLGGCVSLGSILIICLCVVTFLFRRHGQRGSLSSSQQMLLWLMMSFLLGYLMASESCKTQVGPGYRHKPKVELKCFCNCFWLPVVANVSRIQSFAEAWEISRLTFKVIEVHHDTLVCVEARFRRLATSTQHGCFI